jgi:hypothetical protein
MFNYTASGTDNSAPIETDIITLGQGDRGIIEFTPQNTGMHVSCAHKRICRFKLDEYVSCV